LENRPTIQKAERLSYQREIESLFKQGNAFISYPLRILFLKQKPLSGATISILVSVPKRKFKRAVKRNRMKRLIKEAYRLNKTALVQHCREKESGLLIAFLYIGNELCTWKEIEASMQKASNILINQTK